MKKILLPLFCMAVLFGCTTEKACEHVTEVGWFTPFTLSPEFVKGMAKSVAINSFWVTEQDGEYVQGAAMTVKERDSIGWSDDFIAHFDSLGLAKKVKYLDDNGEVYGYWTVHSKDGKYMKAKWVKGDSATVYAKYSYDEAGHISGMERYRAHADTLLNSIELKTNEKGLWISGQWYNYKGEAGNVMSMEYNEKGRVIARDSKNPDGEVISWYKHTYDENGNEIKFEGMQSDSTMLDMQMKYLEFDEKGNWTKVVLYENGEPVGMDVRTIKFY
jgi:hypothetical protein